MHDHDYELIGALAEGALPPDEAQRAETDIATCDECRTDLAAQRVALAAMAESPRPGLTALESARMRKSVAELVGIADAPVEERRRFVPWAGIAIAAAVLVAIVIAAPLVNLLSTGDDDDVSDIAAAQTTIAEAETPEPLADTDTQGSDAPTEAAAESPQLPATEEAAEDDEALAAGADGAGGGLLALGPVTLEDLEALRDTFPEQAGPGNGLELRDVSLDEARFLEFGSVLPSPGGGDAVTPDRCGPAISAAVPGASLIISTATAEFGGSPVLVVAVFTFEVGPPLILVVDDSDCFIVATVGS
jgi:hypothetical protein